MRRRRQKSSCSSPRHDTVPRRLTPPFRQLSPRQAGQAIRFVCAIAGFAGLITGCTFVTANLAGTPYSSRGALPCNKSGVFASGGPEQILECPNGHRWDQDVNAARNTFAKLVGDS